MGRPISGVLCALLCISVAAPATALASPGSGPTAAVSLGDSYISGEAGRWDGNSITPTGDNDGTDRACVPEAPACAQEDKSRVYVGGTAENGCHRSDVAEIVSASIPVAERVNIACSGGQTKNIYRSSAGGSGQNGEASQADQLLGVARQKDVKVVLLSIGGNDLGFARIVRACLTAYASRQGACKTEQQKVIDQNIAKATAAVEKAIDEIRTVMAAAGYSASAYRLILQTYPSVIPRASEARYTENDPQRATQGCPFYDEDLTWARDSAAPQIGAMVKAAAASRGTEVVDLIDALQGHEVCAKTSRPSTPLAHAPINDGEWGRFTGASTVQQGDLQEAFHPNAYAQRALGACVTMVVASAPGRFACRGRAGGGPESMSLARLGDVANLGTGTADGGSATRACAPTVGFRSATVRPTGRSLRFLVRRAQQRRFDVDVFQQAAGRAIIGNRRVARFASRSGTFRWSGRGAVDGEYVVRFTMRLANRRTDVRRVALRRRNGRFTVRPAYYRRASCGVLSSFKLERPVFGGRRNRALGIAFRVATRSRVAIEIIRGKRIVRRFRATTRRAGITHRLRLASEGLRRSEYRVRIVVTPTGATPTVSVLTARRL